MDITIHFFTIDADRAAAVAGAVVVSDDSRNEAIADTHVVAVDIEDNGEVFLMGTRASLEGERGIDGSVNAYGAVVFLIQTILALTVLTFMLLRKRKVSGTCDRRDLVICSLMMLSFVFSSARAVLGRFYMLDNQAISAFISACIGVLFIALGVVLSNGWKDSSIDEPSSPLRSVDPPDGLKAKFLAYMENEKPYLDPDFTLDKAAARLYTNRTYLSVLVNSQFGLPFRDYINRMRIECAKDLIRNHKGTHLEDIALASGFSSGSQFSRKFKEIEGKTPNAWIRSMVQ